MYKLKAETRKTTGRKVKKLRQEGILPGNIYGKGVKSQAVKLDRLELVKAFKDVGETGLIELEVGKGKHPVLVHNIQYDPVSEEPLHVDFHQVNLKEKTTAQVPVEFVGESPAEKRGEGTLVQYIDELEVEALPTDLPERFELDVSGLEEVEATLHIKDISYDKTKIEIEMDEDEIVAKVEPLREEEEAPPAPTETIEEEGEKGEADEETKPEEEKEEKEKEKKEKEDK